VFAPPSYLPPSRAYVCSHGGWKRTEERKPGSATSSFIYLFFDQSMIGQNERGNNRGGPCYFFSFPMLLHLFAPLLGPHRNTAKEWKS
jgi:hypothetical protein